MRPRAFAAGASTTAQIDQLSKLSLQDGAALLMESARQHIGPNRVKALCDQLTAGFYAMIARQKMDSSSESAFALLHQDLCYAMVPDGKVVWLVHIEFMKRDVDTLVRFAGLFRFELELRGFQFCLNKVAPQGGLGKSEYRFGMLPIIDPFRPTACQNPSS